MSKKSDSEKKTKKSLSKKSKAVIFVIAAFVIILAIVIPLCVVLTNGNKTPKPAFSEFDQAADYYVWVKWNKIRKADGYFYKYSYGDPDNKESEISDECYTQNQSTAFERHKGLVAFCVKADIPGEVTEYSDWITMDVMPWVLESPAAVTLDENLNLAWTPCTFRYNDSIEKIVSYKYNFAIDGEWKILEDISESTTSVDLLKPIVESLLNYEKIMTYSLDPTKWEDVEITVRVKAVNKKWFLSTSGSYASLAKIYDDSDYSYYSVKITEDIFNGLIRKNN